MHNSNNYVHALRFAWLNRFYDKVVALTSKESVFKSSLLERAEGAQQDNLDLACGTGTLAIALKSMYPDRRVTGVDGDRDMLAKARGKAVDLSLDIKLIEGLAQSLPFEDNSFDLVTSTLFFHHLETEDKQRALQEVLRVLRPGGRLLIADWGKPSSPLTRLGFFVVQLLDGFRTTSDNARGLLPEFIVESGFENVHVWQRITAPLGTIDMIEARKSSL